MPNLCEAGIDEAGRGPMFGRVYSACVILPKTDDKSIFDHSLLKDSKKYSSHKKLEEVYEYICEKAVAYGIGYCDEAEIDEMNILNATHTAMHRAINNMFDNIKLKEQTTTNTQTNINTSLKNKSIYPDFILVDGTNFKPYTRMRNGRLTTIPYKCFEGGDNLYTPIAAASIIAGLS